MERLFSVHLIHWVMRHIFLLLTAMTEVFSLSSDVFKYLRTFRYLGLISLTLAQQRVRERDAGAETDRGGRSAGCRGAQRAAEYRCVNRECNTHTFQHLKPHLKGYFDL